LSKILVPLLVLPIASVVKGQDVPVQPHWTMVDKLASLAESTIISHRQAMMSRIFIHADNNVLPLRLGDEETLPQMRFEGSKAYYFHARFKELGVSYRQWSLHYGHGKADFYEGNKGAAQLFLDAKSNGVDWLKVYDVDAYLRRTHSHQWVLSYAAPVRLSGREGQCTIAFRWLRMHRLQYGTLKGLMWLGQFQGDLRLLTTRGLPESETRSNGVALDVAIVVPLSDRLRAGIWVENLYSRIWQGTLQDITAKVATNTVEPDADGFLHAVPFMQGRIDHRSLNAKATRLWAIGMAWQQRKGYWLLLTEHDAIGTQVSIGYALAVGGRQKVWLMRTMGRDKWLIGIDTPQCRIHLLWDKFNADRVRRASINFAWLVAF
jgi:hypothetical protein